jgi:hypothetical protein
MAMPICHRRPRDVLAAVEIVLRDFGLDHLYTGAQPEIAVLSVGRGVTVWSNGRTLEWRTAIENARWTAADPLGAGRAIAKLMGVKVEP